MTFATQLSVNINKIALLRNSRGRNYPDVRSFSERFLQMGAAGITLHPRQDQRHARYSDAVELQALCQAHGAELNIEGYPSTEFLEVVQRVRPAQCTLVPDAPQQITSDHGWNLEQDAALLRPVIADLKQSGIRVSLFVDVDVPDLFAAKALGADRVELYTEPYAETFGTAQNAAIFQAFADTARRATATGLGINAGHDLSLENLGQFLTIPNILEVSVGHALIVESLELGMETVMRRYMKILARQ